jgi:hypothetical protein
MVCGYSRRRACGPLDAIYRGGVAFIPGERSALGGNGDRRHATASPRAADAYPNPARSLKTGLLYVSGSRPPRRTVEVRHRLRLSCRIIAIAPAARATTAQRTKDPTDADDLVTPDTSGRFPEGLSLVVPRVQIPPSAIKTGVNCSDPTTLRRAWPRWNHGSASRIKEGYLIESCTRLSFGVACKGFIGHGS